MVTSDRAIPETSRSVSIANLGTTLGRTRCPQPAQLARMRQSLLSHGQLMPVVAVQEDGRLELVDGFKRRAAAAQMGWTELWVSVRKLDSCAQWTAMLTLNRTSGSLSALEEALILRELSRSGLQQIEIAQMVGRHKSWVSRRIGLVERLHPEILEWVRTGMMPAGTARRLMVLPAGNQLELAAVTSQADLTTQETELLVSLWQKTSDPEIRRFLLTEPRRALHNARPEVAASSPVDPRLGEQGRRILRALQILRGIAFRLIQLLQSAPAPSERNLLDREMAETADALTRALEALGSTARSGESAGKKGPTATRTSIAS